MYTPSWPRYVTPQDHRGHGFVLRALELGHRVACLQASEDDGWGPWISISRPKREAFTHSTWAEGNMDRRENVLPELRWGRPVRG